MKRVILGSGSPRRRELLEQIGIRFEVMVSEKEEVYTAQEPEEIVRELALMKAKNVASEMSDLEMKDSDSEAEGIIVIGADTVVVLDGQILGKPSDEKDAFAMLTSLQGREHQVFTGVAVLDFDTEGNVSETAFAVKTDVCVNEMDEEEIRSYIRTGEPMDKAGAYGIQGRFAAYIDRIDGDYYNVVGLPVSALYRVLKKI